MRTRRQDKIQSEAVGTASTSARSEEPNLPPSPSTDALIVREGAEPVVAAFEEAKRNVTQKSKIPKAIQFPLVVILSLAVSSVGYSITYPYTKAAIAVHARSLEHWSEYGTLMAWRIFELALGWFGDYDGYDLAALNLLSHGPPLYLLNAFYRVPASALILTLAIETFATYLPFRLLRSLSKAHRDPANAPNADLLTDKPIALLTTLLSGAIYTVTLFAAYASYLPTALIVYYDSLPSIQAAHESTYINLLPVTLTLGFAATNFIFTPAEAEAETKAVDFDPVNASLKETLSWNFWGWSNRTKTVVKRTAILMLVTGASTTIQTALTVQGAEPIGAFAWATPWVLASAVTGVALGAVGSV
ncbi:hypothetical protein BKA67DRAFT_535680 [Truncatella angustata]|uniref:Uncharacterized protein n=1 Tax=Truncatella angustata TaxID=152316 RepID=A0A9P8ULG5_9PEZI|nr:uncharacterized protein BKA67DRAFT_535680 [Truncatella angustata]KAH6654356.1 hypothetical protein BKA67DRAFT_535680 [Truncatella angustata]KAH8198497.1 hypothetical protein TruAng_007331 [Truncatella angustata]